jgi:hypothetical protein
MARFDRSATKADSWLVPLGLRGDGPVLQRVSKSCSVFSKSYWRRLL